MVVRIAAKVERHRLFGRGTVVVLLVVHHWLMMLLVIASVMPAVVSVPLNAAVHGVLLLGNVHGCGGDVTVLVLSVLVLCEGEVLVRGRSMDHHVKRQASLLRLLLSVPIGWNLGEVDLSQRGPLGIIGIE